MDAAALARELSPKLQALVREKRDTLVMEAGGPVRQAAAKMLFPTLLAWIPMLLEIALRLLAWKFAEVKLVDLVDWMTREKAASPHIGEVYNRAA